MSNTWTTYIIKCSDNTLYTGVTNNLKNRIATHNAGKGAKYTKPRLPVSLFYFETGLDKSTAYKREAQIKRLSRQEKLELHN
jgi:putative endonuclease